MGVEIGATIVGVMVRMESRAAMGTNARSTIIGTPTHPGCKFSKTVEHRRGLFRSGGHASICGMLKWPCLAALKPADS